MVEHTLEMEAGESDVILGFIVNFKASLLWQAVSKYLYMFVYVYLLTHSLRIPDISISNSHEK